MEREYRTIKTPLEGQELKLKSWLTGREKRQISNVFLSKAKFSGGESNFDVDGSSLAELQDTQMKMVIEDIGGNKEKILEKCLDMKSEDYEFVLSEIEKIVNPKK